MPAQQELVKSDVPDDATQLNVDWIAAQQKFLEMTLKSGGAVRNVVTATSLGGLLAAGGTIVGGTGYHSGVQTRKEHQLSKTQEEYEQSKRQKR